MIAVTTPKHRGGEPRAADTATPPRNDLPVVRVHYHPDTDDRGPFHVATCTCGWSSRELADPSDAEFAKARHDQAHADEAARAGAA